ncbi:helicase associated domain-containing protein [Frigoribacterium sp. NBH87]|uniref:helicase associated domain-containing protein n=1 Tax=Frigoribacterium sp. NBH87 TaxID=2596916 RepID=UPI00162AEF43
MQRLWPELQTGDFVWEVRNREQQWSDGLNALRLYRRSHEDCLIANWYIDPHGFPLGRWVESRRADYRAGKLPTDRIAALDTLGMVWILRDSPDPTSRLHHLDNHFRSMLHRTRTWTTHLGTLPRSRDRDNDDVAIGRWLQRQRQLHRTGQTPPYRLRELEMALPLWASAHPKK